MAYEQKPNTGTTFKNDKYEQGGTQPYFKGTALIEGVEYWFSGWSNVSKDGSKPYIAWKFDKKETQTQASAPVQAVKAEVVSDDLPF